MKCHYEVLGLARDADDSEIKISYRKLALRWHPDKNLDNSEEAKDQFQLVQQAYEVLSDQHERAWYDNHREQILRGKSSDYEENCLDLFQYFTVSCFKGYGDDPGGFYHIYADVFEKISIEDAEFMDDEEEINKIPKFGDSKSSYEEVVGPFYAYWQSYCTKKSYAWLCPYNINEIKDRRILREIEKEMKKIVQKAKRERNEEVRNLISFIRKRDKRVQANKKLLEEKAALNRLKQEQNRLEQIRKRKREMEEQSKSQGHIHNEGYEEQLRQLEQEYDNSGSEIGSHESDTEYIDSIENLELDESIYVDDLYCVACNKSFRNDNAFLNHETSKKHKENIEKLKQEMHTEEELFDKQEDIVDSEISDGDFPEIISDTEEIITDDKVQHDEEEKLKLPKQKDKKGKKSKRAQPKNHSDDECIVPDLLAHLSSEEQTEWTDDKKSNKKSKSKKAQKNKIINPSQSVAGKSTEINISEDIIQKSLQNNIIQDETDINHTCVTCKSNFDSKNKLFSHLKKTGHGVYIPKSTGNLNGATGSAKKGKRNK